MKVYDINLIRMENEDFEIKESLESFTVNASDIEDAARKADRFLYEQGVSLSQDDYHIDNCNEEETWCEMSFGDAERGLSVAYEISEQ